MHSTFFRWFDYIFFGRKIFSYQNCWLPSRTIFYLF